VRSLICQRKRDNLARMEVSRRQLTFLLPVLAVAGQQQQQPVALQSHIYHPDQSTELDGKQKKGSRIFFGKDHSGFALEMHETVLGPGIESHPPHKHVHEEIMVILEGKLETNVEGKKEIADRGDIVYFGSNELHNVRNGGETTVRYYVLELRGREA
jgi:quercetin dioxygenase-like cupin family protein